ncbi:MAG TPA: polysaccharide biosynthesis protein, partial [Chitinophagaceae bacterium]|nr:polysaccharide biosynthesis protein [Chitinophagaceae bacterium]
LVAYIVIVVLLYFVHKLFIQLDFNRWINRGVGVAFTGLFLLLILNVERKEFQKLPFIGKYFKPKIA